PPPPPPPPPPWAAVRRPPMGDEDAVLAALLVDLPEDTDIAVARAALAANDWDVEATRLAFSGSTRAYGEHLGDRGGDRHRALARGGYAAGQADPEPVEQDEFELAVRASLAAAEE
ncbi:unnamed protein product, partial [Prorocentrum cordatum]